MTNSAVTSILFVCLGNICRSPLAEGVFIHLARQADVDVRVDSAGTGSWHVGERPDSRALAVARAHGVELPGHARTVEPSDMHDFDHVIAMDRSNLAHLTALRRSSRGSARLHLLREFDPEAGRNKDVPDPYYGGRSGFEECFRIVERSCRGLLESLNHPPAPAPSGESPR